MTASLTIGEVARRAGVPATTLRYYEQVGLVPAPVRVGGQRRYDESVLARLDVIGLCKSAGFALEEIQLLFADDAPGRPASRALAQAKLAEIDAHIASLVRARSSNGGCDARVRRLTRARVGFILRCPPEPRSPDE